MIAAAGFTDAGEIDRTCAAPVRLYAAQPRS
jgi:hypothetical protein